MGKKKKKQRRRGPTRPPTSAINVGQKYRYLFQGYSSSLCNASYSYRSGGEVALPLVIAKIQTNAFAVFELVFVGQGSSNWIFLLT
jgi:hypothetical protein